MRVLTCTTARYPKKACLVSSTATRLWRRTRLSCGRRSLATSETARRRSSISTSRLPKTSGNRNHASECCCRTDTKDRDRNIPARDLNATCNSAPKIIYKSVIRRRPHNTSTCCAGKSRSEERRVGKSVDLGCRRDIEKQTKG